MRFNEPAILHTRQGPHALSLRIARNFWSRFRGLMFARPLGRDPRPQGLLLLRCSSVHGWFMRCTLDVVYLGRLDPADRGTDRYIVTHATRLKPWCVSLGKRRGPRQGQAGVRTVCSLHALEMAAGSVEALGIAPGDRLELRP